MASSSSTGVVMSNEAGVKSDVSRYYAALKSTEDLKTTACTACGLPPQHVRAAIANVPAVVRATFYGCGNPIPTEISDVAARRALTILDLGSGSGRDVYVAAQLAATPKGQPPATIIGLDMTDEQLQIARGAQSEFAAMFAEKYKDKEMPTIDFRHGFIEEMGCVADASVDIIISNCVINLSPRKDLVLRNAYRVLRVGGELYFSDVYCDRRLPDDVRQHKVLFGECLAGALYENDFITLCKKEGFLDPRVVSRAPIEVTSPELRAVLGNARFFSVTYRVFKLPSLDAYCEDYGQVAIYTGNIAASPFTYALDAGHSLERGRPVLVCGNTADMLEKTHLAPFFRVTPRVEHFGAFNCGAPAAAPVSSAAAVAANNSGGDAGGSCCEGGSCCG
jgi:arsenite methyltransferase